MNVENTLSAEALENLRRLAGQAGENFYMCGQLLDAEIARLKLSKTDAGRLRLSFEQWLAAYVQEAAKAPAIAQDIQAHGEELGEQLKPLLNEQERAKVMSITEGYAPLLVEIAEVYEGALERWRAGGASVPVHVVQYVEALRAASANIQGSGLAGMLYASGVQ